MGNKYFKDQKIIKGQECICPDGMGRVKSFKYFGGRLSEIQVETYIDNRSCGWDANNVELLPIPRQQIKEIDVLENIVDNLGFPMQVGKEAGEFFFTKENDEGALVKTMITCDEAGYIVNLVSRIIN